MRGVLRFLPRCLGVIILVGLGLLCVSLAYPLLGKPARARLNQCWSRCLLFLCGIQRIVHGVPVRHGPVLLVANHISWLDIFVINAVRPTVFVAKSEIQRWPVLGKLVSGAGTLFIARRQRHAVRMVGRAMQQRFQCGESVGLFPEGTTTSGFALLPFHCSLFEPARHAAVAIQPLALRFLYRGQRDGYAAFVGEETFLHNLWRVLSTPGLAVEAVYLPPFSVVKQDGTRWTRVELANMARHAIQTKLVM